MPLITAVSAALRVIRQLVIGEDEQSRRQRIGGSQSCIEDYKDEFMLYFHTVLSTLVSNKTSIPRLRTAYNHLEKVRYT